MILPPIQYVNFPKLNTLVKDRRIGADRSTGVISIALM